MLVVFLLLGVVLLYVFRYLTINTYKCVLWQKFPGIKTVDCGKYSSDEPENTYILGRVTGFTDRGIKVYIGKILFYPWVQTFNFYDTSTPSVALTGIPNGDYMASDPLTWKNDLVKKGDAKVVTVVGEEIIVSINTSSVKLIDNYEDLLTKEDISCDGYNSFFVTFLSERSFPKFIDYVIRRLKDGCRPTTSQIYKISQ